MIRILLVSLAMLAVPFIVYFFYDLVRRGPDGTGMQNPRDWQQDSILNLGFIGLFLAAAVIVTVIVTGGGSNEGTYVPARIENGKLIDGGFNPVGNAPERSEAKD